MFTTCSHFTTVTCPAILASSALYNNMENILIYIRQKCTECFRESRRQDRPDSQQRLMNSRLVELSNYQRHEPKKDKLQQAAYQNPGDLITEPSTKECSMKNITQNSLYKSKTQQHEHQEEEYYSIESCGQSSRNSRRSFKANIIKTTAKEDPPSVNGQLSISKDNVPSLYESYESCNVINQIERLVTWAKSEYQFQNMLKQFQVRFAVRLKMKGNGIVSLLMHKLEDYRIAYLSDSRKASYTFANKANTFIASFQVNLVGSSSGKLSTLMSFYRIECSTVAITSLLRLFKSREMLKALHNFTDVALTPIAEPDKSGLEMPVFSVKQSSRKGKSSGHLHLAWQMGEVSSKDEQGQQIFEIGYSLDQGEGSWQRIVKYFLSKRGYIEIYTESQQEIGTQQSQFFSSRFSATEKLLKKRRVLDK